MGTDPLAFGAGMVGVIRASKVKQRHTGTIWGMYVSPRARSGGIGRALLDAAVEEARRWGLAQVQLSVTEPAVAAKRMYESAGFRSWGRQPRSLQWQGHFVDEHRVTLDLGVRLCLLNSSGLNALNQRTTIEPELLRSQSLTPEGRP